tara:strand:- start:73 stop:279 length:207 start_codon:yes stop_codon:yes gene_type:complete
MIENYKSIQVKLKDLIDEIWKHPEICLSDKQSLSEFVSSVLEAESNLNKLISSLEMKGQEDGCNEKDW